MQARSLSTAGASIVSDRPSDYRASMVGFVFQAHNLLPTLTAAENVQVAMIGLRPRARARRPLARAT